VAAAGPSTRASASGIDPSIRGSLKTKRTSLQLMEELIDEAVEEIEEDEEEERYDEEAPADEHRASMVEDLRFSVHGAAGALPWRAEDAVMKADAQDGEVVSKSFFEFQGVKEVAAPWEDPLPFYANRLVEDPFKKRIVSSDRDDGGNKCEPHRDMDRRGATTFYVTSLKFSPPIRKANQRQKADEDDDCSEESTAAPTSTLREPPTTLREDGNVETTGEGSKPAGLATGDVEKLPDDVPVHHRRAGRHNTGKSTASLAERLERLGTKDSTASALSGRNSERASSKMGKRAGRRTGAHLLAMELGRNITESGHLASFENDALDGEASGVEQPSDELVRQAVARAMQNPLYQSTVVDRDKTHEQRPSQALEHQALRTAGTVQQISTRERPGMELGGSIWACATDRAFCNVTSRSSPGPCGV